MKGVRKYFAISRIRKRAEYITGVLGREIGCGWLYSDDKIRIVTSQSRVDICIYNQEDRSNVVFLYYEGAKTKNQHYIEGDWEQYFDECYERAKTRP